MRNSSTTTVARRTAAAVNDNASIRVAAIDVGSNSVHMVIAQVDADGGVTTLWRVKEMVGLGRISFPSHQLSSEAMDRAVASLGRMKQAAQQRQAEKIVAVATSAIREASNGGDLIERIKRELKMYVRVVSAREEARLIYLGIRSAIEMGRKPHLMIDIGGGSVEFIVGDDHEAKLAESRKLGAARMTAQFVKSDPISKDDLLALRNHYARELTPLAQRILPLKPIKCIGTSGTLENIAQLAGGDDPEQSRIIDRAKLEKLEQKLIKSDSDERSRIRGIDSHRKDQIIAGVVLVSSFMRILDIRKIELCGAALREGIISDYLTRHNPDIQIRREVPDPRRRSVMDLARRSNWRATHSTHVAKLLLKMFADLKPLHQLGDRERELIEYGALLHDIGWHITPKRHHRHSEYLILNGELKSFADDEINVMACIARFHRKSTPSRKKHGIYAKLPPSERRIVDVGVALLRLADGLDRSHVTGVHDVKCKIGKEAVTFAVTSPVDIQLELWAARKKRGWFEKIFGKKAELMRVS